MSKIFDLNSNYFLNDKCIASSLTQTDDVLSDFLVPSLKLVRDKEAAIVSDIAYLSNDIYVNRDQFGNRGLSGKVQFLLSAGMNSMEYYGDVASYSAPDPADQNLTSFLSSNFGKDFFFKKGFCFRLSANQDFYRHGKKIFSFGENDYFIINKNCFTDTATLNDIHVIRDAQNESLSVLSDLTELKEELRREYFRLSADNSISGNNAFYGNQYIAKLSTSGACLHDVSADYVLADSVSAVTITADAASFSISGTKTLKDLSDDFQTQIWANDAEIAVLSHAISCEEKRNTLHVVYMGDVTLSDHYPDPDHESDYIRNTLAGMLYTNAFISEDRSKKVRRGFMFRASGRQTSSYVISGDAPGAYLTLNNNDFLLFNSDVECLSSVAVSAVEVIKDYDLSVNRLTYTLSSAVCVKDLPVGDTRTIEEIAASYAKDHWNTGDIIITRVPLYETASVYSYTGYVYGDGVWRAMDGNYSAENVFFTKDFTLDGDYTAIGNIKKSARTVSSRGMSVQKLFEDMFNTTVMPELGTEPSYGITLVNAGQYEVGTSITAVFTVTYTEGKYVYKWRTDAPEEPDGTTLKQMVVKNGAVTKTITEPGANISFTSGITVESSTNYKLTASNVEYNAGKTPENSKGEPVPAKQRPAGTLANQTTAAAITGYYGYFYGYKTAATKLADPKSITSEQVRALGSGAAKSFNNLPTTNMQQIYCAYLWSVVKSKKLTITDVSTGASAGDVVGPVKINVKDKAGRDTEYGLFYVDNSAEAAGSATWKITLV